MITLLAGGLLAKSKLAPSLPKIWLLAAGSLQSLCLLSCSSPLGEQRLGSAVFPRRFRFLAWKGLLRGAGGVGLLFLSAGEPFLRMIFVLLFTL